MEMVTKNKRLYKILTDILLIILGNFCIALAVAFFVLPNKLLVGGTAGIAVSINAFWDIPEELVINILIYGLFIAGAIVLGKAFFWKTVTSTLVYPLLLAMTSDLYQILPKEMLRMDTLTSIICSGILTGFGIGIVYRRNASTGGMDIIPLLINKYTHIPLHILVLAVDGATVLFGVIAYGLQASIYGVISVVICSFMIDKTILLGTKQVKQVKVISRESAKILARILEEMDRGCTIIESRGGYTHEKVEMLMVAVTIDQYQTLIDMIHEIDSSAFVIVSDTNEVRGRGFTLQKQNMTRS